MYIKKFLLLFTFSIFISGCATTEVKVPQPTGGSKADGVIELSYSHHWLVKPKINWDEALLSAKKRCGSWGYSDVEPFGGSITKCQYYSGSTCISYYVTTKYQCTDKK